MGESVTSESHLSMPTLSNINSDYLKAGVRIFSEHEVTLTNLERPRAFGPCFDIYDARIAFNEKEVSVCDASPYEFLIIVSGL